MHSNERHMVYEVNGERERGFPTMLHQCSPVRRDSPTLDGHMGSRKGSASVNNLFVHEEKERDRKWKNEAVMLQNCVHCYALAKAQQQITMHHIRQLINKQGYKYTEVN